MAVKRKSSPKVTKPKQAAVRPASSTQKGSAPLMALPQLELGPNPECGEPDGGRGRVDLVGRRPKGIGIDPNFMETPNGIQQ